MKNTDPLRILDRPIAFHRVFVDWAGSVNAALMLSQLIYWSTRARDPKGWVYKTIQEWEEETGLTRMEQEGARRRLRRAGLVKEKKAGMPARLFFRVSRKRILELMEMDPPCLRKTRNQACVKHATKLAENTQTAGYTSYNPKQRLQTDTPGGSATRERASFGFNGNSTAIDEFVWRFSQFTIKHRLHQGMKGSTITPPGWKKSILTSWGQSCNELLHSLDGDAPAQVKEVMRWYFHHWEDQYVPKVRTLKRFCERFVDIRDAMLRSREPEAFENGKKLRRVEKEMWLDGEKVIVPDYVHEGI